MKKKAKILIISGIPPKGGGSNLALIENILRLREKFDFLVVAPRAGDFTEKLQQLGIHFVIIKSRTWTHRRDRTGKLRVFNRLIKMIYNLRADFNIIKLHRKEKFSLIYINISATNVGAIAANYLKLPLLWHLREYSSEDQNVSFDFPNFVAHSMRKATLIPISESVKDYYSNFIGNAAKFHKINDGIESENYEEIAPLEQTIPETLRLTFLGGYEESKRLLDVLEAIKILKEKHKKLYLNVFGSGYQENIKFYSELAERLGISDIITFHSFAENLEEIYQNSHVVISARTEAFGRVVAEGLCSGRIVIGTNTGASPELIENEKNGYLFELKNPQDLAKVLEKVSQNWTSLVAYTNQSRKSYISRFSSRITAENLEKLLNQELEKNN
ncbi:glycosyltransferase family 4 protein [Lactococcus lactis]|uniref:Glycosyltransferase family 4 protein n=1 Tax=Lactococcus lactis TaxID=1358 RepID=A0A9X4NE63_9LACT|nr:glycosyltransferase family 4 protein [Lactococcus lactis]MDG4982423.1 glycosyltransferase family 4 protein [Lactococcus lactis]